MIKKIFLLYLIVLAGVVRAQSKECFFTTSVDKNVIVINKNCKKKQIDLQYDLLGFEVNCKKTKILIWGKSFNLNPNNPQDSILTILNLNDDSKESLMYSNNIYDAYFSAQRDVAIIETVSRELIDLKTKKPIGVNKLNEVREICKKFDGKAYRKYKE